MTELLVPVQKLITKISKDNFEFKTKTDKKHRTRKTKN